MVSCVWPRTGGIIDGSPARDGARGRSSIITMRIWAAFRLPDAANDAVSSIDMPFVQSPHANFIYGFAYFR